MVHSSWIARLIGLILIVGTVHGLEFESPSKRELAFVTLEQIKYNLRGKNTGLDYRELFDKAIAGEKSGFIGYHGSGLDYLIYQDIIRLVVEEILDIPIRKDFHFVSIPLVKPSAQSLEELSLLFVKEGYDRKTITANTFPLNFALYSNHNRSGLNSVINFSKNRSDAAPKNRQELKQWLEQLGMDPLLIETLYDRSHQHLENKAGVLLQFFDDSPSPYSFANASGYASYPNGFIAENRLISEYFLDNSSGEFPQELRLVLTIHGILNPTAPVTIKRYLKIQPSKLKAWEQDLRTLIQAAAFDPIKRDDMQQLLLQAWSQ